MVLRAALNRHTSSCRSMTTVTVAVGGVTEFAELLIAEIEPDRAAPLHRLARAPAVRTRTLLRLAVLGSVHHARLMLSGGEGIWALSLFANPPA